MSIARAAFVVLLSGLAADAAPAQTHAAHDTTPRGADAAAAFVHAARTATRPYRDQAAAVADGYRLLGPDFPAMGEHWVHPGRMVDGTLDVTRPQALAYVRIDGRPVLAGVIYARPLRGDEQPPAFPVPDAPWHDHTGAIDEESVLLHHGPSDGAPVRLAMLHAWVWSENPAGVFTPDNWALPFVRLELAAPEHVQPAAARALALATVGDAYYALLFRVLATPSAEELRAVQELLRDARVRVERWLAARSGPDAVVGDADQSLLSGIWHALWNDARAVIGADRAGRLNGLIDF